MLLNLKGVETGDLDSELRSEIDSERDRFTKWRLIFQHYRHSDRDPRTGAKILLRALDRYNLNIAFMHYLLLKWITKGNPFEIQNLGRKDQYLRPSLLTLAENLPLPPGALFQTVYLLKNPQLRLYRWKAAIIATFWVDAYRKDPKSFSRNLYNRFNCLLDLFEESLGFKLGLTLNDPIRPEDGLGMQLEVAFDVFIETVLPGTSLPYGPDFLAKCASLFFRNSDVTPLLTPAESENSRRIRRLQVAANLRTRIENLPKPKERDVSLTKKCYAYLLEEFNLAAADSEKKHIFWNVFPGEQGEQDFYAWAETVYQKLSAEIHQHKLLNDSTALVKVSPTRAGGTYLYLPCNGSLGLVKGDFSEVDHIRYQALWDLLDQREREGIFHTHYSLQSEDVRRLVEGLEDANSVEAWSRARYKRRATGGEVSVLGKRARRD